ncbi:MAG: SOS response-associated peptidase [Clostridia bacterium]|nr:SOS response-associated peptidase [Clostridia bacterium]
MCGRYYIEPDERLERLHELFAEAQRKADREGIAMKTGEIFPSDVAPIIANGKDQMPKAFPMRWGLPRPGGSGLVINARSETAATRPMFRESARLRRCLVPATNYFEWEHKAGEKVKYAIRPSDSKLFYMGGLYIVPKEANLALFVILTRTPVESIAFIHDRMPVIVPQGRISEWLSPQVGFDELMLETTEELEYKAV